MCKTKEGLNRHQLFEDEQYIKTYIESLRLDTFQRFVTISNVKVANDQCFESFMGEFSTCIKKNVSKTFTG